MLSIEASACPDTGERALHPPHPLRVRIIVLRRFSAIATLPHNHLC